MDGSGVCESVGLGVLISANASNDYSLGEFSGV